MTKRIFALIALSFLPLSSFAAMGPASLFNIKAVTQSEQFKLVNDTLEGSTGRSLSRQEKQDLAALMAEETSQDLIRVSTQEPTRTIYCVSGTGSAISSFTIGKCIHIWSLKIYDLTVIGGGLTFQIMGSAFRLTLAFDSSRYATDFDPIPGDYGAASIGLTLGVGLTSLDSTSGNKSLTGHSINFGLGFDYPTISFLHID